MKQSRPASALHKRVPNLDILRLFLALEVVAAHCFTISSTRVFIPTPLPPVPTFVCLSGFLIPASFTQSSGWGHFAWKRLLRVGPAFVVSFLLVFLIWGPEKIKPTLLVYLTMGFVAGGAANGVLWSLMLEEVLYAFHAVSRLATKVWTPTIAAICLILSMAAWGGLRKWGQYYAPNGFPDMHMGVVCSFFAGNMASFYRKQLQKLPWLPVLLLAIITSTALLLKAPSTLEVVPLVPIVAVLALTLAYCTPQIPREIPDFSYSLYVFATPILLWFIFRAHLQTWHVLAYTLAACLPLCAASWYLLEKPALRHKDSPPLLRRRRLAPMPEPYFASEPIPEPPATVPASSHSLIG